MCCQSCWNVQSPDMLVQSMLCTADPAQHNRTHMHKCFPSKAWVSRNTECFLPLRQFFSSCKTYLPAGRGIPLTCMHRCPTAVASLDMHEHMQRYTCQQQGLPDISCMDFRVMAEAAFIQVGLGPHDAVHITCLGLQTSAKNLLLLANI